MIRKVLCAAMLAGALSACAAAGAPSSAPPVACSAVAAIEAGSLGKTLDAADPHSAEGVLWADAKAACPAGAAAPGVDLSWIGSVVQMLAQLVPTLAPILAGAGL